MNVSISIVNFNTRELLKDCLLNIESQDFKGDIDVWVVDNNSKDDSVEMVKRDFPKVKLIENHENLGFSKGHNHVLKKINSDFAILVNPDTKFEKNTISEMIDFMEKNPSCAVASCKILGFDGSFHSNGGDFPINLPLISWLFNLESFGVKKNFHRIDENYYSKEREVDWVGGTFMVIRKAVLEKVGFLNEDYFMYFEDVDFCYRVKLSNFKIMINPKVTILHKSGASSKDPHLTQWVGELKGLLYFYNFKFGIIISSIVKVLVLIAIILRVLIFSIILKFDVARTYAKIFTKI